MALALLTSACANHCLRLRGFSLGTPAQPDGNFWAGAAKEELTPPPGYPLSGHGPPAGIARGYWSRLYARAFYFRDARGNPLVLVSCDLYAMSGGIWHAVLDRINQSFYLPPESLIVAATHTHQGPGGYMTAGGYNTLAGPLPGFDKEIFQRYAGAIADAVRKAKTNARPAELVLHRGQAAGLQRNRAIVPFFTNPAAETARIMQDSGVACPPDKPCPRLQAVDTTLVTLEIKTNAAPAGLLVFYSVHPTALTHDVPLISSDFTGRAMELLETTWPVAGFFNGAEGDVSPDWKWQRREDVLDLGKRFEYLVRKISAQPDPARSDIEIGAARREFPNNWHHERENTQPKMAKAPVPGAAVFGGAEDGRAGILYQQDWRGGIVSADPDCIYSDQGCKEPVLRYPLHHFLHNFGLPRWLAELPLHLHLTKLAAMKSFPGQLPIGWVRLGGLVSFAVIPVEMTTAMAHRLKSRFTSEPGPVVIVGLANEYYSYTTTPEEYAKQQYEGASTLSGPREGPALLEMLEEVRKLKPAKPDRLKAERYRVGAYPATPFGPPLVQPRNMVDEDLDAVAPLRLKHAEAQVPRTTWDEDAAYDWQSKDRRVRVMKKTAGPPQPADDETNWNILTVLQGTAGRRHWSALWLVPEGQDPQAAYFFEVMIPGKKDKYCSDTFRLDQLPQQMPVEPYPAYQRCGSR